MTLEDALARFRELNIKAPAGPGELWLPVPTADGDWEPARRQVASGLRVDPLHDSTESIRTALAPGQGSASDRTEVGPRVGFSGNPLPAPRGDLTGLETGGTGSGFPSLGPRTDPLR